MKIDPDDPSYRAQLTLRIALALGWEPLAENLREYLSPGTDAQKVARLKRIVSQIQQRIGVLEDKYAPPPNHNTKRGNSHFLMRREGPPFRTSLSKDSLSKWIGGGGDVAAKAKKMYKFQNLILLYLDYWHEKFPNEDPPKDLSNDLISFALSLDPESKGQCEGLVAGIQKFVASDADIAHTVHRNRAIIRHPTTSTKGTVKKLLSEYAGLYRAYRHPSHNEPDRVYVELFRIFETDVTDDLTFHAAYYGQSTVQTQGVRRWACQGAAGSRLLHFHLQMSMADRVGIEHMIVHRPGEAGSKCLTGLRLGVTDTEEHLATAVVLFEKVASDAEVKEYIKPHEDFTKFVKDPIQVGELPKGSERLKALQSVFQVGAGANIYNNGALFICEAAAIEKQMLSTLGELSDEYAPLSRRNRSRRTETPPK